MSAGGFAVALLATSWLLPFRAAAQTTSWTGASNASYADGTNWTAGVPGSGTTAIFAPGTARTDISGVGDGTQAVVGAWQFQAGASAFALTTGSNPFQFNGAGIVNNASSVPTLNVTNSLAFGASSSSANATINVRAGATLQYATTSTAGSSTIRVSPTGEVSFVGSASGGQARIIVEPSGTFAMNALTSSGLSVGSIEGGGTFFLGTRQLTVGGNNLSMVVSGAITGTGSLVKTGGGTLLLSGTNSYTGGTTLNAGGLIVNGILQSAVTVNGGTLAGSGTIAGGATLAGGMLSPGNSIGTLTLNGNFVQRAGTTYRVEVNPAGQSDRLQVNGTATLNGGTVQVVPLSGSYGRSTTYTILNATGGVTGTYSGVGLASGSFAFLTPSLSYNANNVFLTLALAPNAFSVAAQTPNEFAVGSALDVAAPTATGDFATVIDALAGLSTQQGPAALNVISGQPYSGFGTANVAGSLLFMNTLGQQIAGARGDGAGRNRVALAAAVEGACKAACDDPEPPRWGAWLTGLGGFGNVGGNANAGAFSYNMGGVAMGADYRFDSRFVAGLAAAYTGGRQWVGGFDGSGTTDSFSTAFYASFTQGGFYADALAGYAYSDNQLQRPIQIPGLATRIASGRTGANQFLGQVEAGYKVAVYAPAAATVTPFARLQTAAVSQNAFSESGANSLNLSVAQQNTNSLRTVLGADLAGSIPLHDRRTLDLALRLGWAHEYADTARPMTAAFAGAPTVPFTIYGAQPQRNAAVIGFGANVKVADATSLYLRYDGEIASGNDANVVSAGLRMTW
ncbi:MAG: autotransporter domain-containing protein [Reyranella sp.]|nr:autotransporter domain-containing protein [Reyranella sp.]